MRQSTLPEGCAFVGLPVRGDDRGNLIALEQYREVPFEIARVYFIYGSSVGVTRGLHAHRNLKQFAVPVVGSCDMVLDDGNIRVIVTLNDRAVGLLLPPMVWHEMSNFSDDCVLMVVADAPYEEADYIRNYQAFLEAV